MIASQFNVPLILTPVRVFCKYSSWTFLFFCLYIRGPQSNVFRRDLRQPEQKRPCCDGLTSYPRYASASPPEVCGGRYHVRAARRHRTENRPRYELFVAEQTQNSPSVFRRIIPLSNRCDLAVPRPPKGTHIETGTGILCR